jgi:diphosphate-dependent phosphofructokinase
MPSTLQKLRMEYQPPLPQQLKDIQTLSATPSKMEFHTNSLADKFPKTYQQPRLTFIEGTAQRHHPLRVGFVFSGGQAAGGHNVAAGLFDALKKLNSNSLLFGFLDGPKGIIENKYHLITADMLASYRNQGGFDLVGSGRTKIETDDQFAASAKTVSDLKLDGLVIIGGDDSNTNAALLAEYFLQKGVQTRVVGVPKTIDGDLKNEYIELPFGFDSATKTFSEIIGNILVDALSAKKYTFFIKVMGRTASHIALECALQTQPNLTFIGEEVEARQRTIRDITHEIADLVVERSKAGKDYGVILLPEGLIEFIPECKILIKELNSLLAPDREHSQKLDALTEDKEKISYVLSQLSQEALRCFSSLPTEIQLQLLLDRDPHGNVQVSKIDTERLFIETVRKELKKRQKENNLKVKFSPQPLFCGYEGRSCLPSNFDSQYCYALGHVAALLIDSGATGYICCIQKLHLPAEQWEISGIPLVSMIHLEERQGKSKPVIKKALVELEGIHFKHFSKLRDQWRMQDDYINPGPIQFFGPDDLVNSKPKLL